VTVCYFGEAAANQGAFHETLNMASKWSLPVIFLCENNRYGMGTAFARVSPLPEVYKRAAATASAASRWTGWTSSRSTRR
jgi:pyruvate dehydrogenase E1 component alpha subunit